MIDKLAIWYLKKKTGYLWEVYNEGFNDGIEQAVLEFKYAEEMENEYNDE